MPLPRLIFCAIASIVLQTGLAHAQKISLSGVVSDSASGDALPGASVILYAGDDDSLTTMLRGAATNAYGFYAIPDVPIGTYLMVVQSIGYAPQLHRIVVSAASDRYDLTLVEAQLEDEGVTVTATRTGPPTREIGRIELPIEYLPRLPMFGGESDILRTLQLLPGVQQVNEISSGLYVRGGSPDQNLTLLDEVIIYNPSHLAGFLSTFNSDAVKSITLIKGAFPSKYGGRLSSVLDLTMREGTKEGFSGAGGVSLISSRLTVEGPISDKSTFMVSGRRFYLDILKNLFPGEAEAPDYYFYDLNGKVNYELGASDKIYLSGYHGRDVVTFHSGDGNNNGGGGEDLDVNWGNSTANLRWARIFSPTLFTNLSASYTRYGFDATFTDHDSQSDLSQTFAVRTGIQDLRLKGNAQIFPHPNHIIETGAEGTYHDSKVRAVEVNSGDSTLNIPDSLGLQNATSFDVSLYAQDEWKVSDRLSLNLGGRVTWFEKGNYLYAEPRVSAAFKLNDYVTVTGAYTEAHQPVHLVIRNGLSLPTDTWFPATEKILPGFARQGSLGVQGSLDAGTWDWSVEGYYKDLDNLYEYADTASFSPFVQTEDQLVRGTGVAWGVEFFLQKKLGDVTGWIGYGLAETERTFADLNDGKPFHPRYDRRHDLKLVLMYQLGKQWDFGMSWVYGTGQAFTVPTGQYGRLDPEYPSSIDEDFFNTHYRYTQRNAFRLPAYHRLDVNFSHTFEWFKLPWRASINIYNVYNRRNVFTWYIDEEWDEATQDVKPVVKQFTLFPIIPTFGISFEF